MKFCKLTSDFFKMKRLPKKYPKLSHDSIDDIFDVLSMHEDNTIIKVQLHKGEKIGYVYLSDVVEQLYVID